MNREDFMAIVYDELATDVDNLRANRIIEAYDDTTVHGCWKKSDFLHGMLACSECGVQRNPKFNLGLGEWNYCPNCGAKMTESSSRRK